MRELQHLCSICPAGIHQRGMWECADWALHFKHRSEHSTPVHSEPSKQPQQSPQDPKHSSCSPRWFAEYRMPLHISALQNVLDRIRKMQRIHRKERKKRKKEKKNHNLRQFCLASTPVAPVWKGNSELECVKCSQCSKPMECS